MSEQTKYKAVSGKYTMNGTPNGVTSITPLIVEFRMNPFKVEVLAVY
ncbi:glyoxalase family protein [Paenibacillus amylolyticus]|uniref:Glyoxalase family protein n=1 Tax=Paenibacillus amylolyticus TaxID=1451 RepID=A0A124DXQ9_PAEAM|nr:glyoxalase family protein [Paenibacillus amylolyticus]